MSEANELIREFVDFNKDTPNHLRELKKKTGKKMVGWTCNYIPTELIIAAGIIPVRLLSRPSTITVADLSLQNFACNIARSVLDQLLKGELDYLDGIVTPKVCDTLIFTHDIQQRHNCCDFSHFVQMPGEVVSKSSKIWWQNDVLLFKRALEEFSGNEITEKSMEEAIEFCGTTRKLLRSLYELRKGSHPPLYGHEILQVVLAGMMAPTPEYHAKVKRLVDALPVSPKKNANKVRLMVIGSTIDFTEMALIEEFEKEKGIFVTDDMCTGTRWIYRDVEAGKDPLAAITDRYHYAGFCAAKHDSNVRMENIRKLAQAYKVEGAVVILEKFCPPFGFSYPDTKMMFKEIGIPTLLIESAETEALGQSKTKAQAFFEMIRGV